ncbi:hypothetical protein OKJ48_09915 [Streptomyces kunmingensis]|uniref:Secreted protein n=1 Tax=Streptomyces kunmingensis TaxID=68225 RepID=A0ABU6C8T8_9ACTN|nr:hypothetical protein [Streptomyces kunmingensis]MEB3960557.1 hypothetical protein [Streptomyces kunmingensis]
MKLSSKFKFSAMAMTGAAVLTLGMAPTAQADTSGPLRIPSASGSSPGYVEWNPDPYNGIPGDSMRVCDTKEDGWGITAKLRKDDDGQYNDRTVTTRGHNSPYCSPWASGNLPENTIVGLWVFMAKENSSGSYEYYAVNTTDY